MLTRCRYQALPAFKLIGSVPGAYLGAQLSSRAPGGLIRRALALVLLASALKLLRVSNEMVGVLVVVAFIAGTAGWMVLRRINGLPALARFGLQRG